MIKNGVSRDTPLKPYTCNGGYKISITLLNQRILVSPCTSVQTIGVDRTDSCVVHAIQMHINGYTARRHHYARSRFTIARKAVSHFSEYR
jgi:hypothetical protein